MPSHKVIEVLTLSPFLEKTYIDLFELNKSYVEKIQSALKMLDQDSTIAYEFTDVEGEYADVVRLQRKGINLFAMQTSASGFTITIAMTANDVLNMLYKHAPYMPMVGCEVGMDLEIMYSDTIDAH